MGRPRCRLRQDRQAAGRVGGQDRRHRRVEPRPQRRDRDGRAALPARRRRRHDAVRWRAPPRRAVPVAAVGARPAAARRADQPPRRRVGRLARTVPAGVRRHRRRHHPRSLLPRQRRQVDPRARPRPRHPVRGQLLVVARTEAGAPRPRGALERGPPAVARARARVGADGAQGAPGEGQGPPRRLREVAGRGGSRPRRRRSPRDRDPARAAPRRHRHRGHQPAQGLRRPPAHRRPVVHASAGRDRRHHRAQRRRQDDAVQDADRSRQRLAGGLRAGRCRHDQDRRHRRS